MKMKPALVIFTKLPVVGHAKTRLGEAISEEKAAELQKRFLLDVLATAENGDWEVVISHSQDNDVTSVESLIKTQALCMPQRGGSLGIKMRNAFQELFNEGFSPVVMIGADIPTVPLHLLKDAFKALRGSDIVLGPSADGGYYLIGMHRLHEEVFRGVEWSTPWVLRQTVKKIRETKLKLACLDLWYDIDTVEDLLFLRDHIEYLRACGQKYPVGTYRYLKKLRL